MGKWMMDLLGTILVTSGQCVKGGDSSEYRAHTRKAEEGLQWGNCSRWVPNLMKEESQRCRLQK